MRLVIIYTVTDECHYWFEQVVPVEYESAEAFLVDFEKSLEDAISSRKPRFLAGGQEWDKYDFLDGKKTLMPEVLTVDEWFDREV